MIVTDGSGHQSVEVAIQRAAEDEEFNREQIEDAVERLAGKYPREVRMASMVIASEHTGPLSIRIPRSAAA